MYMSSDTMDILRKASTVKQDNKPNDDGTWKNNVLPQDVQLNQAMPCLALQVINKCLYDDQCHGQNSQSGHCYMYSKRKA